MSYAACNACCAMHFSECLEIHDAGPQAYSVRIYLHTLYALGPVQCISKQHYTLSVYTLCTRPQSITIDEKTYKSSR